MRPLRAIGKSIAAVVAVSLVAGQVYAQDTAMRFANACERAFREITIAGVGDVLPHQPLQTQAAAAGTYAIFWQDVMPILLQADIVYANLESPIAAGVAQGNRLVTDPGFTFDNNVYTGFPLFNAYPQLATALGQSGFDIVSTANNHAMDRGPTGVDRTIEALQAAGLPFTGTRSTADMTRPFYTIIEEEQWRIAFLACTYAINGLLDPNNQVLKCFDDRDQVLSTIAALAAEPSIDAVIVTPHWGDAENTRTVTERNIELGRAMIEAGAIAVIGTHPHVVQPWERYVASDGREGLIVYSTGNFVSNQSATYNRIGMAVFLGLSRNRGGDVWISGVRYHLFSVARFPIRVRSLTPDNDPEAGIIIPTLTGMLGTDRQLLPGERLDTTPEC